MRYSWTIVLTLLLVLTACRPQTGDEPEEEDLEAKAMLQGIWRENETEEVSFRAEGDTIYFADAASMPVSFRVVGDSISLGDTRYAIVKLTDYQFWFKNQAGDERHLTKSVEADDSIVFEHAEPEILTLTEVLKRDSVVFFGGERYHWYVAVNPTTYKVNKMTYNTEGMGVENVYYDNIIHVSLYKGADCLFSRDFKKQTYEQNVPEHFLSQAILGNMEYDHIDAAGLHFHARLCIPDGASCYLVETLISFKGELKTTLLEY